MWATAEQKKPGPDDKLLLHFAATGGGGEIGVGTLNEKYRDKNGQNILCYQTLVSSLPTLITSSFTQCCFKGAVSVQIYITS